MSHNVCYSTKFNRPKSSAIFVDGKWLVAVGDLVYVRTYTYSNKLVWLHAEVCSFTSTSDSALIELYIPCLMRRLCFDIRLGAEVKRCFDAVIGAHGDIIKIGDTVCEVDDLFHLDYKVLKVNGHKLLCRHEAVNGFVKYPSLWLDSRIMELMKDDKEDNN